MLAFFFCFHFLRTFNIVTWFYILIFILYISVPISTLFCMCAYIFVRNVHPTKNIYRSDPGDIFYRQQNYVFTCERTWTITDYSCIGIFPPNIFKSLVWCCACMFKSLLEDVFDTLIGVMRNILKFMTSSSSLSDVFKIFYSASLSYKLGAFSSLSVTKHHELVSLVRSNFDVIPDLITWMTCLLLTTSEIFILLHSKMFFLLLISWETRNK